MGSDELTKKLVDRSTNNIVHSPRVNNSVRQYIYLKKNEVKVINALLVPTPKDEFGPRLGADIWQLAEIIYGDSAFYANGKYIKGSESIVLSRALRGLWKKGLVLRGIIARGYFGEAARLDFYAIEKNPDPRLWSGYARSFSTRDENSILGPFVHLPHGSLVWWIAIEQLEQKEAAI